MARRTDSEVRTTRSAILDVAVAVASVEGLEGLTIGRLAEMTGMSKSGLIGHFGDKERLQLATVDAAVQMFTAAVWEPLAARRPGLSRLRALIAAWLAYARNEVFPGGCFLSAASFEFDDRPGPVRDAVAAAVRQWLDLLEREAINARSAGDLSPDTRPDQLAFEINALLMAANWSNRLLADPRSFSRARAAIDARLAAAAQR